MMLLGCECVHPPLAVCLSIFIKIFLKSLFHLPKLQALHPSVTLILHYKFGSQ